jgi:hypothetical protein
MFAFKVVPVIDYQHGKEVLLSIDLVLPVGD